MQEKAYIITRYIRYIQLALNVNRYIPYNDMITYKYIFTQKHIHLQAKTSSYLSYLILVGIQWGNLSVYIQIIATDENSMCNDLLGHVGQISCINIW